MTSRITLSVIAGSNNEADVISTTSLPLEAFYEVSREISESILPISTQDNPVAMMAPQSITVQII
jgi:hypothetical protein